MKTKLQLLFIALALFVGVHQSAAQGTTAFTYQGQLHDNGTNANGTYTMIFALYDSASGGNQVGSTITTSPTLANGLFTVNLDFGAGAFNGSARWLDIIITNGGTSQELSPRVEVLPSPYAQFAAVAATVANGAIMNAQLAGNSVATINIQSGAITTTQIANGAVSNANLAANAVATTNIQDGTITDSKIAAITSLLSTYGSETNLRVVRGFLSPLTPITPVVGTSSGTYTSLGSNYTATYYPPGSGGALVGYFDVTDDGKGNYVFTLVSGSINNGGITANEWIEANGGGNVSPDAEILQVQSTNTDGFTTYGEGCGSLANNPYNQIWVNPRLASEWDITFTPPFSGFPVITVSSGGISPFSSGAAPWVGLNLFGGTNFQAVVGYNIGGGINGGYTGGCWPLGGAGFRFIAIGPK
jgi:hypothetical protein